jgi:hypothetical protein
VQGPSVRRLKQDNTAVASGVIAFLVAGVLFMGSVVAVLVTTRSQGNRNVVGQPEDQAAFDIQAAGLADVLLGSPGYQSSTSGTQDYTDWASGASTITGKTAKADSVTRLGLLNDPGSAEPSYLNFTKFQNLRRAPLAANPTDGFVNYDEAVQDLGLANAGLDFHIRAYPALTSVKQMLACTAAGGFQCKDGNLRVTYIGHYDVSYPITYGANSNPVDQLNVDGPTCSVSSDTSVSPTNTPPQGNPSTAAQNYRLSTTVANGGQTDTQFTALFTYRLAGSTVYQGTRTSQTFVVPHGSTSDVYVDIPAKAGISCAAGTTITVQISEPLGHSVTQSATLTSANAVTNAHSISDMRDLYLQSLQSSYTTSSCSSSVQLAWSSPTSDVASNDFLGMKVVNRNTGAQVWPSSGYYTFKGNTGNKADLSSVCLAPGEYRGYLYYSGSNSFTDTSEHVVTRILVTSSAVVGYVAPTVQSVDLNNPIYTPTTPIQEEVHGLDTLVQRFCPSFYNSKTTSPTTDWDGDLDTDANDAWTPRCASFASAPTDVRATQFGDVIPDYKKAMDNDLPARLLYPSDYSVVALRGLPRYDVANVLVVGSDVDQTAMTSGAAKFAVRDWVLGGGNLVVFGSDGQNVNWLEPLFHSAIRSSSGGISVPDASHPILHTPDELDNPAITYDSRGQAWDFNGQTAQAQQAETTALFTNVIVQGGDATLGDPLLADSKPGAIGNGTIILSSYLPYDLYGAQDTSAGQASRQAKAGSDAGSDCPGRTFGQCEGMKFMHNLLMSGYGDLYLDYGPPIPDLTDVQPSVHVGQIRSPDFTDPVQLTLIVYVFRA